MRELLDRGSERMREAVGVQLGRAASWIYDAKHLACLYVLLIPGMAIAYTRLPPASFYDGNLHREHEYAADRRALAASLLGDYRRGASARLNKNTGLFRYAVPQTVHVSLPRVVDDRVVVTFTGDYINPPAMHSRQPAYQAMPLGSGRFWVTYRIHTTTEPITNVRELRAEVAETGERWASDLDPLPAYGGNSAPSGVSGRALKPCPTRLCPAGNFGDLVLPPSQDPVVSSVTTELARRSIGAAAGDPTQASHRFLRMLYLSSVVITTVGFGDITPISIEARLLVGAEAVAGVIIVGLFLSAITGALGDVRCRRPDR